MWLVVLALLSAAQEAVAECLPGVQAFIDESNGVVDEAGFMELAMAVQGTVTCDEVDWETARTLLATELLLPAGTTDADLDAACQSLVPYIDEALAATCDGSGATRTIDRLSMGPATAPGPISMGPAAAPGPISTTREAFGPLSSFAPLAAPAPTSGVAGGYGDADALAGGYSGTTDTTETVTVRKLSMHDLTQQQEAEIMHGAVPKSAIIDGLYSRTLLQDTCNVSAECIDDCEGCEVHAKYCSPLVVDLLCLAISEHVVLLTSDGEELTGATARVVCVDAVSGACAELEAACQECDAANGGVCADLACCPGETGDVCGQGCCCCPLCMVPSGRTCECVSAPSGGEF